MKVSKRPETISFDRGISMAEYAAAASAGDGLGDPQRQLLPGSTSVSQALAKVFPEGESVTGEIMSALVAGNPTALRTPSGFRKAAMRTLASLRQRRTEAARNAVAELEGLLADTDLFDQYRSSLLEM